jgi:small subunit ribosomal protein S16
MPAYHIVAADSRAARTGKFLEIVGRYEPLHDPMVISTKEDRLFYWLRTGAQPTDTVRSLLQRNGQWMKWSMVKRGVDTATIAVEMEKWQMAQVERRQRDEARRARRLAARRKARTTGADQPAPEAPAAAGTSANA